VQKELLPQQSVARHKRVFVRAHVPLVTVASTIICTFVPQHASTAVGGVKFQGVAKATVMFGAHVMTGGVVSTMVTTCVQNVAFEQQSVICQLRVANFVHGGRVLVNVLSTAMVRLVPQHASKAVGASNDHAVPHCTVLFVAHVTTGGLVSTMRTISVQVAIFVQQS
jgi:hypothetical protein